MAEFASPLDTQFQEWLNHQPYSPEQQRQFLQWWKSQVGTHKQEVFDKLRQNGGNGSFDQDWNAAKDAHWQSMSPDERAKYASPMSAGDDPLGYAIGRHAEGDRETQQAWSDVDQFVGSLPVDQQQKAIDSIRRQVSLGGGAHLDAKDIRGILGGLKGAGYGTPEAAPSAVPVPATGAPSEPAVQGEGAPSSPFATGVTPGPATDQPNAQGAESIGGYADYQKSNLEGVTDLATLAQISGEDPGLLKKEYDAYVTGVQRAQSPTENRRGQQETLTPMTLGEFANMKANSNQSIFRPILDALDTTYYSTTKVHMPVELRQRLLQELKSLPQDQMPQIRATLLGLQSATAGAKWKNGAMDAASVKAIEDATANVMNLMPAGFAAEVKDAASAAPESQKEQERAYWQQQLFRRYGDKVPPGLLDKLVGMPSDQATDYLDNQAEFKMGLSYGQWSKAQSRANTGFSGYGDFNTIFGRSANDQEIYNASKMTDPEYQDWMGGAKSHVHGVSVAQYTNYSTNLDHAASKYGITVTPDLIAEFHKASGD